MRDNQQPPTWRILVVDDDPQIGRQVKERADLLDENAAYRLQVIPTERFDHALQLLEATAFDLLIIDVRLGHGEADPDNEIGVRILKEIQARRFIPTIFYTGLPALVNHLTTALIRVVEKTEGIERLLAVAGELIATKLPHLNRALLAHVQRVQAGYMWDFVAEHWTALAAERDGLTLAYLLARRLSASLTASQIGNLAEALGHAPAELPQGDNVHAAEYYLIPSLVDAPSLAGDIYAFAEGRYRVLLTPSCDLVQKKCEFTLWADCTPLSEASEYKAWAADKGNKNKEGLLRALLRNNRNKQPDRYFFLPGAYTVPDLVVDFERLSHTPYDQLDQSQRIASLDSPFVELLLSRFARFFGRLGTPDLDTPLVFARLNAGPA
jgi:CheY-like chemotaxis protein